MGRLVRGLWLLGALVGVTLFVWPWHSDDPPSNSAEETLASALPGPAAARSDAADGAHADAPDRRSSVVSSAGDTDSRPVLRVRLVGLHPRVPWAAELHLLVEGRDGGGRWLRHDDRLVPLADGRAAFELPAWALLPGMSLVLVGDDPNYQVVRHRIDDGIDPSTELRIDVQVVGTLQGRVVTATGEGVPAARVTAFAMVDGVAMDRRVGSSNTGADGAYRVRVPPDQPLFLVAVPMHEMLLSGLQFVGEGGGVSDDGAMRGDWLPAGLVAQGAVGEARVVPDLVLPAAAKLTGRVVWEDGTPVPLARVAGLSFGAPSLRIGESAAVQVVPGALVPAANTQTDPTGHFVLPAVAGQRTTVVLEAIGGCEFLGEMVKETATAPGVVELRVARPVLFQVRHGADAVAHAKVELALGTGPPLRYRADEGGDLRLVTTLAVFRVRACAAGGRSPWIDVDPRRTEPVVLQLSEPLCELVVEFRGSHPVRNATFRWRATDGADEGHATLVRDDSAEPFRLQLSPGRYRLRIGSADGERNGRYLLPSEHEVELGAASRRLEVEARFGGRFTVHATDGRGLYIAGSCRVFGSDGGELTEQFVLRGEDSADVGAPGELMAGGPNEYGRILAPGEYRLEFEFPDQGLQQRRLVIRPRETVDVRLRLP